MDDDRSVTGKLVEATQERKVCKLWMRNEGLPRIVHPYGVCTTSRGKVVIVCWQVAGFSGSGELPSYKNLTLEKCERLELLASRFRPQQSFNPQDTLYTQWLFRIQ